MAVETLHSLQTSCSVNEPGTSQCSNGNVSDTRLPRSAYGLHCGIEAILSDSEGVENFHRFLCTQYSSGHLLDFWFACKGFRSNVDPGDSDKLFQVAKVIYRTYIKTGASCVVPLPSTVKHEIIGRMSSYHRRYKLVKGPPTTTGIDRTLFDLAQESVRSKLEELYYPKFLDFFSAAQSPSHTRTERALCAVARISGMPDVSGECYQFSEKSPRSRMRRKRKGLMLNADQCLEREAGDASNTSSQSRPSSFEAHEKRLSFRDRDQSPNERFCTEAKNHATKTEPDEMLLPDKRDRARLGNAEHITVKQGQNLAETDPSAFVLLLTARLEKIKESRGKMEKLLSWVNQVDEKCYTSAIRKQECPTVNYTSTMEDQSNTVNPSLPALPSPHIQCKASSPFVKETAWTSRRVPAVNPESFNAVSVAGADEDAQGILDDHCSRIWADDFDPVPDKDMNINLQDTNTPRRMVQSFCVPEKSTDPIYRHSPIVASTIQRRRRVSLSATAPECSRPKGYIVKGPHRYRSSCRHSDNRSKRSDARSTGSWDSGVVDSYVVHDTSSCRPEQSETETKSIIAAASLQALSSSTTELAIVNSEVTAQLVERMTRHYSAREQHPHHQTSDMYLKVPSTTNSSKTPLNRNCTSCCQTFTHPSCGRTCRFSSVPSSDIISHSPGFEHTSHCNQRQLHQCCPSSARVQYPDNFFPMSSHSAFPAVSDSSSTFDSGISSTYDKLPIAVGQANTDRSNGNSAICDWPAMESVPLRHPSAPGPQRPLPHNIPLHSASGSTGLSINHSLRSHSNFSEHRHLCSVAGQTTKANSMYGRAVPTPCSHHTAHPTGQLLQCWLQLQNSSSKRRHQMVDSTNSDRCVQKSVSPRDHSHNNKHSKALSVHSGCSVPPPAMVQSLSDKSRSTHHSHRTAMDILTDSKDVIPSTGHSNGVGLIVGYYLCDDPVPYRTVWMGPCQTNSLNGVVHQDSNGCLSPETASSVLTLGQFKQLIPKKGVYRYFFKKPSDEFGTGAVHEEITEDSSVLPLWEGKVVARIERAD